MLLSFLPQIPIPDPDPMPLPAPVWLLKTLLVLTFVLHVIPMNFILGGGFIAALSEWRGGADGKAKRLARDIARMMPAFIAATITLGVAPLLFVQLLYGHLLYTSSVLIGEPWISVLLLLILAYYGYYYYSLRSERAARGAVVVAFISSVFFALIAFIFTNNMTLMLVPERWRALYAADPSGWNLNLGDPAVLPRYLHMVLAAFAIAGMILALRGVWELRRDDDYGRWMIRRGALWFMIATGLNYAAGFWFLLSLPREHMLLFLGGNPVATASFSFAFLLSLAAILLLMQASTAREKPALFVGFGFLSIFLTVVLMSVMRDILRTAYLQPHFNVSAHPVATQTSPLALFLITFVIGLGVLGWMLKKTIRPDTA